MRERSGDKTIAVPNPRNTKAPLSRGFRLNLGGKPGIRTLGTLLTFAGFQDRDAKSSGAMFWGRTAFHNSPLAAKLQALFYKGREISLGTVFAHTRPTPLYRFHAVSKQIGPVPTTHLSPR